MSSPAGCRAAAARAVGLLGLVERRNKGMQDYGVLREEALAFTSWRGPLGSR